MSKEASRSRLETMCLLLVKRPEYRGPDGKAYKAPSVFDSQRREFYKMTTTTFESCSAGVYPNDDNKMSMGKFMVIKSYWGPAQHDMKQDRHYVVDESGQLLRMREDFLMYHNLSSEEVHRNAIPVEWRTITDDDVVSLIASIEEKMAEIMLREHAKLGMAMQICLGPTTTQ